MSTFDPYQHFGFLTHRVSRLMDLLMYPKLNEEGYNFPSSCIGILADLWSKDGVAQKELGLSMIKNKSSVTKMLEALEKDGLIEKKDDSLDKRKKLIYLTDKGHKIRDLVKDKSKVYREEIEAVHSAEEIRIAKKVLKTIYLNLKEKVKTENQL